MSMLQEILEKAYAIIKANQDSSHEAVDPVLAEAMREYATAMVRHNLEKAAAKARTEWIPDDNPKFGHYGDDVIVKESITGIEIELI